MKSSLLFCAIYHDRAICVPVADLRHGAWGVSFEIGQDMRHKIDNWKETTSPARPGEDQLTGGVVILICVVMGEQDEEPGQMAMEGQVKQGVELCSQAVLNHYGVTFASLGSSLGKLCRRQAGVAEMLERELEQVEQGRADTRLQHMLTITDIYRNKEITGISGRCRSP